MGGVQVGAYRPFKTLSKKGRKTGLANGLGTGRARTYVTWALSSVSEQLKRLSTLTQGLSLIIDNCWLRLFNFWLFHLPWWSFCSLLSVYQVVSLLSIHKGQQRAFSVPKGFPCDSTGKEPACNVGDMGSILGLGRSPGEGNCNPLQYSCLENSMDRRVGQAAVHGIAESNMTVWLTFTFFHFRLNKPNLWGSFKKLHSMPIWSLHSVTKVKGRSIAWKRK